MQGARSRRSVNVDHLLVVPWMDQHCGQLAFAILHDVLGLDVREHDLWIDTESANLESRVEEYLSSQGDRWKRVEAPSEVGDVMWSVGAREFGKNHLSVVVALDPVPMIASTRKASGPFIQRASANKRVLGVYRFVG